MMLPQAEILALHRAITAIRSVSGEERELADFLERWWRRRGFAPRRLGNSLLLLSSSPGELPVLLLDTHLDTVPPAPGWTRDPWDSLPDGGKVHGLGANDSKASVAAMIAAFSAFAEIELPFTVALALVEGEETRGTGTEAVLAELERQGRRPAAAVIGEPTGLDLAIAQKGLLVLELVARGDACHAANARALGAANAARCLAHDLVALEAVDLGPPHARLGAVTVEPTQLRAGTARNVLPGEAVAVLDVRTTPALPAAEVVARLRQAVGGELRVLSDRLAPSETPAAAAVVEAARRARPGARLYGSATLSDMVFMAVAGIPAVKCGPGRSERSHTADEFVWESEVLEGARFYTRLIGSFAEVQASMPEITATSAAAGSTAARPTASGGTPGSTAGGAARLAATGGAVRPTATGGVAAGGAAAAHLAHAGEPGG